MLLTSWLQELLWKSGDPNGRQQRTESECVVQPRLMSFCPSNKSFPYATHEALGHSHGFHQDRRQATLPQSAVQTGSCTCGHAGTCQMQRAPLRMRPNSVGACPVSPTTICCAVLHTDHFVAVVAYSVAARNCNNCKDHQPCMPFWLGMHAEAALALLCEVCADAASSQGVQQKHARHRRSERRAPCSPGILVAGS